MPTHTILAAIHDGLLRRAVTSALISDGHRVEPVKTTGEGMALLNKQRFDLVLSELSAEELNGIALAGKAKERDPLVGVILLAGYHDEAPLKPETLRHADEFLLPPYEKRELYFRIELALLRRAMRKQQPGTTLVSVCSNCKKARERGQGAGGGSDRWVPLDLFLDRHTSWAVSHGLCPECAGNLDDQILQYQARFKAV